MCITWDNIIIDANLLQSQLRQSWSPRNASDIATTMQGMQVVCIATTLQGMQMVCIATTLQGMQMVLLFMEVIGL